MPPQNSTSTTSNIYVLLTSALQLPAPLSKEKYYVITVLNATKHLQLSCYT